MLLPFICIISAMIIMRLVAEGIYTNNGRPWHPELKRPFSITLGIILGLVSWAIMVGVLTDRVTERSTVYKEQRIYSLKNDHEIHGSFFLGCGNIDEYEYYFFFVRNNNGRKMRGKERTCNVEIEETNNKRPCIAIPYDIKIIKKSKYKHPKLWFLKTDDYRKTSSIESYSKYKILYVPIGTIQDRFELY